MTENQQLINKELLEWYSLIRKKDPSPEDMDRLLQLSLNLGFDAIPILNLNDNPFNLLESHELKPTAKEKLISIVTREISRKYRLLNLHDTLECYKDGVYIECEDRIKHEIESIMEYYSIGIKTNNYLVREVLGKLKRKWWKDPKETHTNWYTLAFTNGLLDINEFVQTGFIEIRDFNPETYVQHKIPHPIISINQFMEKEYGLEAYMEKQIDIKDLAEKQVPYYHKIFSDWIDKPELLYEIIGYCFYKAYPIHRAFMLVGEGSNGKSTYLDLIRYILGKENVASIQLQALAQERFAASQLYRKLANIYADLPNQPLKYTGIFKILTGEDQICADRKFKEPICFTNYAKLIFSANELPEVNDQTYAFWRRWITIEFPNKYTENKRFKEEIKKHEQLPKLITVSLYALRNVLLRSDFTVKADFKEEWMRRMNSVYAFIKDRIEKCEPTEEECYATKEAVYHKYQEYCEEHDLKPYPKNKFSIELQRWVKVTQQRKRLGSERVYVWKGIRLKEANDNEDENTGLLSYS